MSNNSDKENNLNEAQETNEQWRKKLTPEQFMVCREAGTELPFSGKYLENKKTGKYVCIACAQTLFSSSTKYNAGSGWPSFWQPISNDAVIERKDPRNHGREGLEVLCAHCESHLGHVFKDGPLPTKLRYCINSIALNFIPESTG